MPRPATGKTPSRNFRISDAVYDPARRIAGARGESLTDIVEKALIAYAKRYRTDDPGPDRQTAAELMATSEAARKFAKGRGPKADEA